jgi:hypothetical protein
LAWPFLPSIAPEFGLSEIIELGCGILVEAALAPGVVVVVIPIRLASFSNNELENCFLLILADFPNGNEIAGVVVMLGLVCDSLFVLCLLLIDGEVEEQADVDDIADKEDDGDELVEEEECREEIAESFVMPLIANEFDDDEDDDDDDDEEEADDDDEVEDDAEEMLVCAPFIRSEFTN